MTASACAYRINCARNLFTFWGAIVGLLFATQGVLVFVGAAVGHEEPPKDFWKGCQWAAHGVLYVVMGLGCFFFELRSCCNPVKFHLGWFAANRVCLALAYVWLGCYAVGGAWQDGPKWSVVLGQVTGILSWCVGFAHLMLSGCAERPPAEPEAHADNKKVEAADAEDIERPHEAADANPNASKSEGRRE
mmetsp:Transcript_102208/g.295690  ORF Transcript_102208/g.295690 Transcript_102208/m.295690 type:complete len:190 (+) Transcript_102208:68-637(+)